MRANEQHPPAVGSYHALLQTQIYDYFIYYGLSDCAQALLSSDCIMQHKGVNSASPHYADGPYDTTPSLPDSSFHSSLGGGAVIGNHDGLEAHQGQPPILYQWFTTFWDAFNPYQMDAGVLPSQDGFNLPQGQLWEPVPPQQILYGDLNNIPVS
ncbi:hypothetical protein FDECE_10512 [Fusarium decemcellulare]|nr:hypothetical protein FDECE_10512 [Fusarium decemcellulare]